MEESTTIHWVRHAESCANLLDKKITDKPIDISVYNQFADKLVNEDKQNYTKPPFDCYIEHANRELEKQINLEDAIHNEMIIKCQISEDECWKSTIGKYKAELSAEAIFTKERMIKSSWLFTPTLSYIGVQQAIHLGKNETFNEIVNNTNIFITSATVRTIMTSLLSLNSFLSLNSVLDKKITIIVVPFINERENVAGHFNLDNANRGIPPDKMLDIINKIIEWFGIVGDRISIDIEFYTKMCKQYHDKKPLVFNVSHFQTYILPELKKLLDDNSKPMNILAYSHGYVITELSNEHSKFLPNISIYEQKNDTIQSVMNGVNIRITDTTEIDRTNKMQNICSLDSLRGEVNKILFQGKECKGGGHKKKSKIRGSNGKCKRRSNRKKRF